MTTTTRVSSETNRIRLVNGWTGVTCTTCCRPVQTPYRRHDQGGKVVQGCVDSSHEGHVFGESGRWHNRPEAKLIRKQTLASLSRR